MKKTYTILTSLLLLIAIVSCGRKSSVPTEGIQYVATTHALGAIVSELTKGIGECRVLLQPGASPHTYSPVPSDIAVASRAKAIFYADDNADGWAKNLRGEIAIRLIGMLPDSALLHFDHDCDHDGDHADHNHGVEGIDPHFWTDPLSVKAILPKLVDTLCSLDPANAERYKSNGKEFVTKLESLHAKLSHELEAYRGKTVFLFHPSFLYFLRTYGLQYGGAIEVAPGKEPSPKYITELTAKMRAASCKAIYSEPQLPEAPAKTIAESCNAIVLTLDPIGGTDGRKSYEEIVLFNLAQLLKGF